jgi:hypothetical protein
MLTRNRTFPDFLGSRRVFVKGSRDARTLKDGSALALSSEAAQTARNHDDAQ